ncbi:inorganic diphosphatase [Paenibacillus larvae]|jgi:inorganic pyrophosphatase|uniref:Inorganic pyrophosphatase n=3 Tax=Paenibacillus larvae TaxID=1464 RepID=V9W5B6_9BACL|nr:inorganic diphosphatase [Paenibacillus larvae]AHD05149.1 inorganic pyrophosphatase Ppa [Paenibacillus larvae subsp. larvae DSM 25430]AQR79405.1 inorganic diphosphatase [Paenibacillus larvae subsp. larvae]AQZ47853.1 inorganic diphosphatase [Paenibacillus larvae subsp. pulvifaciens]AVF23417.1 inorganic pyrophosphatase Ppa [Paenibacillus larvae subsp. larvae]AVF25744.1 inorganic pyrophosphatase Ppa [Paenibacillus larvae subsp. larvae]
MSNLVVEAFIEIPTGSQNKYEFDKERNVFVLDRVLYSPMFYPAEYGYLENTLALDGDPLDILVLSTFPTFPGCVIESRVVGVLVMSDDKGQDEKLLAVPVNDPRWNHVQSLNDVPEHTRKEISHFFQVYKDLENKTTKIEGWKDADFAKQLYEDCLKRYKEQ